MDTKLTLRMEKKVIEKAKRFALRNNTSLSRIVEDFFKGLEEKEEREEDYTPAVRELSGIIKLGEDFDSRDEYAEYLIRKYI